MEMSTKTYKSSLTGCDEPAGLTGVFTANYNKAGTTDQRYFNGVKCLLFVYNCPNRYWALKAVRYWLKCRITQYGYCQDYFDKQTKSTMHATTIIPFTDLAFGVGYNYLH